MKTPLPSKDVVLKNSTNKKELIFQLCSSDELPANVHMIGEDQNEFGHEEADTSIISYVKMMIDRQAKSILVACDDTDVLVLLIYFSWKWEVGNTVQIYMKCLCDGKIYRSVEHLGEACKGIIGLHALTGCDTVSYTFKKGKSTAYTIFLQYPQIGLEILGEDVTSENDLMRLAKTFFSLWYCGKPTTKESLRHYVFRTHRTTPKLPNMPPTDDALKMHVLRAHLQASIWKSADKVEPPVLNVNEYGWQVHGDDTIPPSPLFGVVEMAPQELLKGVACNCIAAPVCSRESCGCRRLGVSCTSYCKCHQLSDNREDSCKNPHTTDISDDVEYDSEEDEQ